MASISIKCRHSEGVVEFKGLSSDMTFLEFSRFLQDETSIPIGFQKISLGYPPKPVIADESTKIKFLFTNNCVINLTRKEVQFQDSEEGEGAVTRKNSNELLFDQDKAPHVTNEPITYDDDFDSMESYGLPTHRKMPDDNSCLFHSIAYILEDQVEPSMEVVEKMRTIVAQRVLSNSYIYSKAFLTKEPIEYANWIMRPESWGGTIEISILSEHYANEIFVLDVCRGIFHCFGENKNYEGRIYLIYDGIHYDAMVLCPRNADYSLDLKVFSPRDKKVEQIFLSYMQELTFSQNYVDTSSFSIICKQCYSLMLGDKQAYIHAKSTGHSQFEQIKIE